MRVEQYFRSLTMELEALKDRVRYLIDDGHWQTDGEWKESVIRQVLRRHLPVSTAVGRGFVVSTVSASRQIDVLISDVSKPVLFRDGDLAFVTPDAVVGIIEVKTRATPAIVAEAATKLATDMAIVRRGRGNPNAFAGVFAFDDDGGTADAYLRAVGEAATRWDDRLDFVCIGCSRFIRYWHFDPKDESHSYEGWHSYALPNMAAGYFIHNVISATSRESVLWNKGLWFPVGGKEPFCDGEFLGTWPR